MAESDPNKEAQEQKNLARTWLLQEVEHRFAVQWDRVLVKRTRTELGGGQRTYTAICAFKDGGLFVIKQEDMLTRKGQSYDATFSFKNLGLEEVTRRNNALITDQYIEVPSFGVPHLFQTAKPQSVEHHFPYPTGVVASQEWLEYLASGVRQGEFVAPLERDEMLAREKKAQSNVQMQRIIFDGMAKYRRYKASERASRIAKKLGFTDKEDL